MARKTNPITQQEIDIIKSIIKNNGKIPIENPVDCKALSYHIYAITDKTISESTIKRFFGFHVSNFSPSYDTIRILREYISKTIENTTPDNNQIEKLVIDFFNPHHFENIDKGDKGFHASCRKIALHIRSNPVLFEKIMEPLAKSETGRAFYYELFPDYEILSAFQYKGYEIYLQNEESYEGKLFAHCLLFMKYFFDENFVLLKQKWLLILKLYDKNSTLHPFVLGRYYQVYLIGTYYFKKKEIANVINEVFLVEKKQPRDRQHLFWDFPGFHYYVCDALWYIDEYESLLKLSEIALKEFKKSKEFIWKGYYDHLYLYNSLALVNIGKAAEARKNIKYINPENFYFITKAYFEKLYDELQKRLN